MPSLVFPEVAGAAARRTQDPADGLALLKQLLRLPNAQFFDLNLTLARAAAQLASRLFLRGEDAQYAALAAERRVPLVTPDLELHDRAANRFESLSPEEWVARFAL